MKLFSQFPDFRQLDKMDCGPICLKIIAKHYGSDFDLNYLREISGVSKTGSFVGSLLEACNKMKMDAMAISVEFTKLKEIVPLPCIIHWQHDHFMVVYKITDKLVYVSDPKVGLTSFTITEFIKGWTNSNENEKGVAILIRPRSDFETIESKIKERSHFSFMKNYFRPYSKLIIQLIIGMFVGLGIEMAFPFLTQSIVDYGVNYNDLSFIKIILFAQLFLYLAQVTVELIRSWIILHVTLRVNIQIISDYILILLGMPIAFFDTKTTGDFVQRMQDHKRVSDFLSANSLSAITGAIEIVFFAFILLYFNATLFIIFVFGTFLYFSWHSLFLKRRGQLDYVKFEVEAKNSSKIIQLIRGVAEIKFNASQSRRRAEWYETQKELFQVSIESLKIKQAQINGGQFIHNLKNIIVIFVAANLVVTGNITLGTMLAVMFILGSLNTPMFQLINFSLDYQDAKLSFQRLAEIHGLRKDQPTNLINNVPKAKNIIFKNVNFKYPGTGPKNILSNINCSFPIGKTTAIVGSSGSGKTTILKLLLKVQMPTQGTIFLNELNLNSIDTEVWRKSCGIVLQDGYLFNDTIKRNITESDSMAPIDMLRYNEAIKIANLSELIEELPLRDETLVHTSGSNLSGGEMQRLLIARVVYKNPDFIFFDEATSSLDSNNESQIIENLNNFYNNRTVIVVAHRLSTVRNADKIIVLDKGKIVESGKHEELIAANGSYFNLVMKQL